MDHTRRIHEQHGLLSRNTTYLYFRVLYNISGQPPSFSPPSRARDCWALAILGQGAPPEGWRPSGPGEAAKQWHVPKTGKELAEQFAVIQQGGRVLCLSGSPLASCRWRGSRGLMASRRCLWEWFSSRGVTWVEFCWRGVPSPATTHHLPVQAPVSTSAWFNTDWEMDSIKDFMTWSSFLGLFPSQLMNLKKAGTDYTGNRCPGVGGRRHLPSIHSLPHFCSQRRKGKRKSNHMLQQIMSATISRGTSHGAPLFLPPCPFALTARERDLEVGMTKRLFAFPSSSQPGIWIPNPALEFCKWKSVNPPRTWAQQI